MGTRFTGFSGSQGGCGCCGGGGGGVPCGGCNIPATNLTMSYVGNNPGAVCDFTTSPNPLTLIFNGSTEWIGQLTFPAAPPFGTCTYYFRINCVGNKITLTQDDAFHTPISSINTDTALSFTCSPFSIVWSPPAGFAGFASITITP